MTTSHNEQFLCLYVGSNEGLIDCDDPDCEGVGTATDIDNN